MDIVKYSSCTVKLFDSFVLFMFLPALSGLSKLDDIIIV